MKIAVDFDGTIVDHDYPSIGKVKPFAFQTLKMLQEKGHLLILWTYRSGKLLDEAVEFCRSNGIVFYAVNADYPDQIFDTAKSRKINCDYYIDDRNIGGLPSWGEIYNKLHPGEDMETLHKKSSKKSFRFFRN